jgi:hypothetical protein
MSNYEDIPLSISELQNQISELRNDLQSLMDKYNGHTHSYVMNDNNFDTEGPNEES